MQREDQDQEEEQRQQAYDPSEFLRLLAASTNQQQPTSVGNFRLPQFWVERPASWFAMAECQFHVRRITDEFDRYCVVVAALPLESVRLVSHVLEHPPAVQAYSALKQLLLSTHQLTPYQRMEQLFNVEPLGARKPSELLAIMLDICPRGEEKSAFFSFLFLQRLPREIRVLLADDDHADLRTLADKADRLHALHAKQSHDCVAAVDESEVVAAVDKRGGAGGKKRGGGGGGGSAKGAGGSGAKQQQSSGSAPKALARKASGLCFFHWTFGEKATRCEAPCTWQGN